MIRFSIKAAVLTFLAAFPTLLPAQHANPSCAVPCEPTCAVPPACCDPSCAAPGNCSSCYQPQAMNCQPKQGLFCGRLRPLFSWTHIEIESNERNKCCPQQACSQGTTQGTVQGLPVTMYQPVQIQMTAYQPVAVQQFVQPVQQFVTPVQQVVAQPVQQFVTQPVQQVVAQPVQQLVAQPVQQVVAQQVQSVQLRPATAATQGSGDPNCCEELRKKITEIEIQIAAVKSGLTEQSDLERRISQTEELLREHQAILKEIRDHLVKTQN